MVPRMRIGVDLGGTKIEIIALDDAGAVRARRRVATPAGDYDGIVAAIAALVRGVETQLATAASVGVGMPGAISLTTGLVKNANSTVLIGRRFPADLESALAREIRIENDANCFALSEARDGAGADAATVFGVILGTGAGGGIVIDGRVVRGRSAIAGEWGHNPLPWPRADERPGPACYCGKMGCIETFVSGTALHADHLSHGGTPTADLVAAARGGDDTAAGTLARYEDRLARALASVVNVLDPHAIVLGGGVSNLPGLAPAVAARMGAYVFSDTFDTPIRIAQHGDSSGVRGAAWLWPIAEGGAGAEDAKRLA